jgi:ribosome biogenesis GTPase / thiamine phosphate phosphatase
MNRNDELLEWQSKIEETSPKATSKRILVKLKGAIPDSAINARVVAAKGRLFLVKTKDDLAPRYYECLKAGRIISANENSKLVAVGDRVKILPEKKETNENIGNATIIAVEARDTFLSRKDIRTPEEQLIAANIDHLIIMASAQMPSYNTRVIDRLLVAAELGVLEPVICINKMDLGEENYVLEDMDIYKKLGIEVFLTSFTERIGLSKIKDFISSKSSVLIGPSGVGKSTFINELLGKKIQKISDVSNKTTKGKHITSFVRSFELPEGGEIIDTPGIREFALYGIGAEELTLYFHDFDDYYEDCRFMPCSHTHEPGCAIKRAVENEQISIERYESYLNIYETLKNNS